MLVAFVAVIVAGVALVRTQHPERKELVEALAVSRLVVLPGAVGAVVAVLNAK